MKQIVILASGNGRRMMPYSGLHNKAMIKISNRPIISYNVEELTKLGADEIIIICNSISAQMVNYFRYFTNVKVIDNVSVCGNAKALECVKDYIKDDFLLLYGDTIIDAESLEEFYSSAKANSILLYKSNKNSSNILADADADYVNSIRLASRSDKHINQIAAFMLPKSIFDSLKYTPSLFPDLNVGVMPDVEYYIEALIDNMIKDGHKFEARYINKYFFDMDKPWDILIANDFINRLITSSLTQSKIHPSVAIAENAKINGNIVVGENSNIGNDVKILGNVIIGKNTVIDNGAIIYGGTIIGDNCTVQNYALVYSGNKGNTTICDGCIVDHCSEIYSSVIFDKVSFAHYGEFSGIVGCNTDIGAGTISGSLRFDDNNVVQRIGKKNYYPEKFSTAVYLGNYNRTGIGAMLMPGIKTGNYCIVGSGVVLDKDLDNNKIIMLKQETVTSYWGPEKYNI